MKYFSPQYRIPRGRVTASLLCAGLFSLTVVSGWHGVILAADPAKSKKEGSDQGDRPAEEILVPGTREEQPAESVVPGEKDSEAGLKGSEPVNDDQTPDAEEEAVPRDGGEPAPEETADEWDFSGWEEGGEKKGTFDVNLKGFVELDNHISTYLYQDFGDIFKKTEIRANMNLKMGTDKIYLLLDMNFYGIPYFLAEDQYREYRYTDGFEVGRNLRLSHPTFEFSFNEFYVNYDVSRYRFRLGNQVYPWGTADVMSPSSYFNPYDLRELLFKDEDELRQGVPSFSGLVTVKNHTVELVAAPVHVPTIIAEEGNFWAIRYKAGPFPVTIRKPRPLDVDWKNIAVGARYYVNQWNTDFYLSAYHGPDGEPLMRPLQTLAIPYEPVSLLVGPEYRVSDRFGFAVSRTAWKFTLQGEAVYSPNRYGVVTQYTTKNLVLPFMVRKGHNLAYTAGFNFFVPVPAKWKWHDGELVFTAEWSQNVFFDEWIMKPLLTDLLVMRLQDSFLRNRLRFSVTSILDIPNKSYALLPVVGYRFDEGVTVEGSYVYINSSLASTQTYEKMETSSFLGYYNDNDMITLKVRYEY